MDCAWRAAMSRALLSATSSMTLFPEAEISFMVQKVMAAHCAAIGDSGWGSCSARRRNAMTTGRPATSTLVRSVTIEPTPLHLLHVAA